MATSNDILPPFTLRTHKQQEELLPSSNEAKKYYTYRQKRATVTLKRLNGLTWMDEAGALEWRPETGAFSSLHWDGIGMGMGIGIALAF